MPKFYRYILAVDDGHAPCSDDGLLTLGTCKPIIRRCASEGDWVAGYMPKRLGEGSLVWFGQIKTMMHHRAYELEFRGRKDANYRYDSVGLITRVDASYHAEDWQMHQDTEWKVLVFDMNNTWYFGGDPEQPPEHLDQLKAIGQGHRVNLRLDGDIENMKQWLCSISKPGIHGSPRDGNDADCASSCGTKKVTCKPRIC